MSNIFIFWSKSIDFERMKNRMWMSKADLPIYYECFCLSLCVRSMKIDLLLILLPFQYSFTASGIACMTNGLKTEILSVGVLCALIKTAVGSECSDIWHAKNDEFMRWSTSNNSKWHKTKRKFARLHYSSKLYAVHVNRHSRSKGTTIENTLKYDLLSSPEFSRKAECWCMRSAYSDRSPYPPYHCCVENI